MNFKELLTSAQDGDAKSLIKIIAMYNPLLVKESVVNSIYDEDLYQELGLTLLNCIRKIKV